MGSARVERRSRKRIGRRAGIIVAMLAALVLLMGFAGMAIAETASDDGAQPVEKVSVTVKAKWADDNDADGVRPSSVKVQLMADGKIAKDAKDKPIVIELAASKDWKSTVKDLDKTKDGKAIKYTLAPNAVDKYEGKVKELEAGKNGLNFEVTFTPVPAPAASDDKVDNKAADDAPAKDEAKSDEAPAKDEAKTDEAPAKDEAPAAAAPAASDDKADDANADEADFTPQADDDDDAGDAAKKDEAPGADGKADAKTDDDEASYTPMGGGIEIEKIWDCPDGTQLPDSITLYFDTGAGGGGTLEMRKADNPEGSKTWRTAADLAWPDSGNYTMTEAPVRDFDFEVLEQHVDSDGIIYFKVQNTYNPFEIKVTKKWNDSNDKDGIRPDSVDVQLLANGDLCGDPVTLNAGNKWTYTFTDIDKYDEDDPITYTIEEVDVPDGYTSKVAGDAEKGFTVTNTHKAAPDPIDITVSKKWSDSNDADGIRPKSVTVHLLADGEDTGESVKLNAGNKWKATFSDLDAEIDGATVKYTVKEDAVKGYTASISGNASSGFTITNTHKAEPKPIPTTSITATKVWKDKDNIKKTRENVTLYLVQKVGDGKWTTVSGSNRAIAATAAGDGLKVTWTGLPTEDENGNKIEYCVAEQWTKNYTSKVTGDVKSGFTVTNTLGRVPKTGDTNAGGAAAAVVLVIAAAGVFAATRRTRKE